MVERLPEYIDPLYLADKNAELKGQLFLSELDRLADLLYSDTGTVAVELRFAREGRLATLQGLISAELELKCQNCLQLLAWPLQSSFRLGLVNSMAQADRLPEDCEPLLVVEGQKIPLKDIVEDELLLALPSFPKHQHPCYAAEHLLDKNTLPLADKQPDSTENPFSILTQIKKTGDS